MKIKIVIADDHQIIIDGLKSILNTDNTIEVIGTVNDGAELLDFIEKLDEIDVIILDINMPNLDGIEATKVIKNKYPEIKILILSMYNKSEFIKNLINIGADGYILKNSSREIFIEAITTLYQGKSYFSEEITKSILNSYKSEYKAVDIVVIKLSEREKEVVKLIAEEKSTQEIAEVLFLSKHTVNSHRKSILNKLGVKNAAGVYRYALQIGIIKGFG